MNRMFKRILIWFFDLCLLMYWSIIGKLLKKLPLNMILKLTGLITSCVPILLFGLRRRLETNISVWFAGIYSDKEIKEIARRSMANYAGRRLEELYIGTLTQETIGQLVSVYGKENLEESVRRGKGTIILLSHFGSFLLPLPAIGFMGYRISQLGGPPSLKKHRPVHEKIFKLREKELSRLPVSFFRSDLHLRSAIKALKKNELLAIAFDGREGDKWTSVKFLNRKAIFSPGPLKIAQATGATIIPTFIIRQKNNTHRIVFEKPFEFEKADTGDEELSISMQKISRIFENYILKYPCHFVVTMHIIEERAKTGIVEKPIFNDIEPSLS